MMRSTVAAATSFHRRPGFTARSVAPRVPGQNHTDH